MPDFFWMLVAYLAGAASAEGVRRTIRKFSGGFFFGKSSG